MEYIPKKIHYCWFGGNPLPDNVKKYIRGWEENCPDYELVRWDESNFDINSNLFVKEAYENKKWAFVSDYVRLFVLYEYGGIYMDSDVEVIKTFDPFLKHRAFTGCESEKLCVTGTMGAERRHPWIGLLLAEYKNKRFIQPNGKLDMSPNTNLITNLTIDNFGWERVNRYQLLREDIHIYPFEYFCAKNFSDGKINVTSNTVTIHHFSGSWLTKNKKLKKLFIRLLGPRVTKYIISIKHQLKEL